MPHQPTVLMSQRFIPLNTTHMASRFLRAIIKARLMSLRTTASVRSQSLSGSLLHQDGSIPFQTKPTSILVWVSLQRIDWGGVLSILMVHHPTTTLSPTTVRGSTPALASRMFLITILNSILRVPLAGLIGSWQRKVIFSPVSSVPLLMS